MLSDGQQKATWHHVKGGKADWPHKTKKKDNERNGNKINSGRHSSPVFKFRLNTVDEVVIDFHSQKNVTR